MAEDGRFDGERAAVGADDLVGHREREAEAARRAANEAAALAWITAYPLLVFPALFDEKADMAISRAERQEEIRERSRELLCV